VVDLGDKSAIHVAHDFGNNQSDYWGKYRSDFYQLFKDGYYYKFSTSDNDIKPESIKAETLTLL
jgi:hypothetical protein